MASPPVKLGMLMRKFRDSRLRTRLCPQFPGNQDQIYRDSPQCLGTRESTQFAYPWRQVPAMCSRIRLRGSLRSTGGGTTWDFRSGRGTRRRRRRGAAAPHVFAQRRASGPMQRVRRSCVRHGAGDRVPVAGACVGVVLKGWRAGLSVLRAIIGRFGFSTVPAACSHVAVPHRKSGFRTVVARACLGRCRSGCHRCCPGCRCRPRYRCCRPRLPLVPRLPSLPSRVPLLRRTGTPCTTGRRWSFRSTRNPWTLRPTRPTAGSRCRRPRRGPPMPSLTSWTPRERGGLRVPLRGA